MNPESAPLGECHGHQQRGLTESRVGSLKARPVAPRSQLMSIGHRLRRGGAAAYGVLLISLLLTALAHYYVRQNLEAHNRLRFDEITQATQEAIERRTNAYLDAMLGARGLFYASRSIAKNGTTTWKGSNQASTSKASRP